MSVGAACAVAGFSGDALRQRRKHNAEFRAAERWARYGEQYVSPEPDLPDVVVDDHDPVVTDVTWRRPERPKPEIERPLATGPTNTTISPPPAPPKKKPSRRYGVPQWVPGSGYEDY